MTSRFRNELTIIPPVQIKVTRRGLATTIDWSATRAAQPATRPMMVLGVVGDARFSGPLPTDRYLIPGTRRDYGGGDVATMTSPGLTEFKALLLATRDREREIRSDVGKAKRQLAISWIGRALSWATLAPAASKSLRTKINKAVELRRSEVATLNSNLASSRLSISFDMDTAIAEPHRRMLAAFDELSQSAGSWAVQTTQHIDRVRARSVAGIVVSRRTTKLRRSADPLVDTADVPLALTIQGGKGTAYFYPGFILVIQNSGSDIAVVDLKDLSISYTRSQFTEAESVPGDAQAIGKAWAKANKNGSRDRRFKHNRELPIMLYGEISLDSPGGINEAFMFSRNESCALFASAFKDLKSILQSAQHQDQFRNERKSLSS